MTPPPPLTHPSPLTSSPLTLSLNKLALLRYKTIDACLGNRGRKWTLEDLIEKVSDALYEYEGIRDGVSKRTVQLDLQTMRSDKLGYSAPIVVVDRKYYTYEDPKFSITRSKITHADLDKMNEVVGILRQFNGFSHFGEMTELIAKLEAQLYRGQSDSAELIQFESNPLLKGLNWLDPLYKAILHKTPLLIEYRSFRARSAKEGVYYPYLLKAYRNRWFLIARNKHLKPLLNLALDRIENAQALPKEPYRPYEGVPLPAYFADTIGVTKTEHDRAVLVMLEVEASMAPYVLTKPLHASQKILRQDSGPLLISIEVVLNFELEREILGFGESIKVLSPKRLVQQVVRRLEAARRGYGER